MPRHANLEYYADLRGDWRWRFVSANGRVLADSGEGYESKAMAKKGFASLKRSLELDPLTEGEAANGALGFMVKTIIR